MPQPGFPHPLEWSWCPDEAMEMTIITQGDSCDLTSVIDRVDAGRIDLTHKTETAGVLSDAVDSDRNEVIPREREGVDIVVVIYVIAHDLAVIANIESAGFLSVGKINRSIHALFE